MPKLSDTQLVILSAAANRENGAVLPLPKSLKVKGAAVTKTLEGLCKGRLLEEKPAAPGATAWREAEDGRRMTLVITESGMQAIGGGDVERPAKKPRGGSKRKTAAPKVKGKASPPLPRQRTKQAVLISLLKRKRGATIAEAAEATGWQAHSVRGAISGTLKKKLGLDVTSGKVVGRGRVYRIARQS